MLSASSSRHFVSHLPLLQRRFFLLFVCLLVYLILYPFTQHGSLVFRLFGSAVTLLSIYAISYRHTFTGIGFLLALPALWQRIFLPGDGHAVAILSTLLTFVFDVFIVVLIFRRVFDKRAPPDAESIFGALCIYLLAGFSFASLYSMVATVQPHAFYLDPTSNLRTVPDRFDLIYYSFGTIVSLGAPGITPVSDQARSLSVIEALLGLLYLAVLISKLMSAYTSRPRGA